MWDEAELPEGWKLREIGDIAKVVGGGTPKTNLSENFSNSEGHPWITPADLTGYSNKYISHGRRFLTDQGLASSSAKYMPANTVLFSTRAPIGYVAIAQNPVTTNQGFRSFVPTGEVDAEYLYYALKFLKPLAEQMASGTTFPELSGSKAAHLPIAYPSLKEQQRIVKILDTVTEKTRTVDIHLYAARHTIERFRLSVLAAACSGRLTIDWCEALGTIGHSIASVENIRQKRMAQDGRRFREPQFNFHADFSDLPSLWQVVPLGLLIEDLQYGTSKRSEYGIDGIPVLRIPNVSGGHLSLADLKFTKLDKREAESLALGPSDLLMIRSNGSPQLLGRTVLVTEEAFGMAYAGYLIRLRVDTAVVNPEYLTFALAAPQMRTQIEMPVRSTSGVHNINSEEVRGLIIPLPSLQEQDEIVRRAKQILNLADTVDQRLQIAKGVLERSAQAVLAKAFRGELLAAASDEQNAELVM